MISEQNHISVLLISRDEEAFVGRCIGSVSWAHQVLLLDSGSTDRTVEIATAMGADVVRTSDYPGWAAQFNRASDLAKNDWVLVLDCDEIVTSELAASIQRTAAGTMCPEDGYSANRRGDFLGVLLPNSSNQTNARKLVRLFNRNHSRFADDWKVHEQVEPPGRTHLLDGDIIHWRGYSMDDYFNVFNDYATQESASLSSKGYRTNALDLLLRPIARFLWLYFRKAEWRLGMRGLIHAGLKACSEFMRYSKLWELEHVPNPILHPTSARLKTDSLSRNNEDDLSSCDGHG